MDYDRQPQVKTSTAKGLFIAWLFGMFKIELHVHFFKGDFAINWGNSDLSVKRH